MELSQDRIHKMFIIPPVQLITVYIKIYIERLTVKLYWQPDVSHGNLAHPDLAGVVRVKAGRHIQLKIKKKHLIMCAYENMNSGVQRGGFFLHPLQNNN